MLGKKSLACIVFITTYAIAMCTILWFASKIIKLRLTCNNLLEQFALLIIWAAHFWHATI